MSLSTPISVPTPASFMRRLQWTISDTLVITRRNLIHYRRQPQLIVFSTIQPVMFVLLFAFVFGGAISTPDGDYINFLLPGILVQTVLFGSTQISVGLAEDLSKGMIDRFRSLPMARAAVLAGLTLAGSIRNVFVVFLMIIVGYIIGFRFQDGIVSALLGIGLVVLFGYAFSWIAALIGLTVKNAETAQVAGFIWLFPLVFASGIFVPTQTMPDGLRIFAENQPITAVVNAVRAFTLGGPKSDVWLALAWLTAIWVVFAFLAVRQYRRVSG